MRERKDEKSVWFWWFFEKLFYPVFFFVATLNHFCSFPPYWFFFLFTRITKEECHQKKQRTPLSKRLRPLPSRRSGFSEKV